MSKWILFMLMAFCPFAANAAAGTTDVNTDQLKQMISNTPSLVIVDARTAEHDNGQRIENALVLPYNSTEQAIQAILPNKEAPIVVYCWSARCPMSKYLADRLIGLGYSKVYKYPDGLSVWIDEMGPITTVEKK